MNLDPAISGGERVGSLVIGAGLVAYALLGNFDKTWVLVTLAILGLAFAVGGIGGT